MQIACKYGYEEIGKLLIEKMDSISLFNSIMSDIKINLLLHLICRYKTEKYLLFKSILEKFERHDNSLDQILAKEDNNRQTVLHIAIENNHLNIIELLFKDYNINKNMREGITGNLAIHVAAKNGSIEMLKLLHNFNAVSFRQNSHLENALHIAATNNKHKFIKEFLKHEKAAISNADSNPTDAYIPCACLCSSDYVTCAETKNAKQYTPLFTAIASLNQKCVQELLKDSSRKQKFI